MVTYPWLLNAAHLKNAKINQKTHQIKWHLCQRYRLRTARYSTVPGEFSTPKGVQHMTLAWQCLANSG